MNRIKIPFLLCMLILVSCTKDNFSVDKENLIAGVWNYSAYENDLAVYSRSTELDESKPGYIFRADGTLTTRQNAGWCGTPPVTYGNFEGKWEIRNDTLIDITAGYWGGTMSYVLEIALVDNTTLKVKIVQE